MFKRILTIVVVAVTSIAFYNCSEDDENTATALLVNSSEDGEFSHFGSHMHGIAKILDLSDTQKDHLREVLSQHKDELIEMHEALEADDPSDEMKEKHKALRETVHEQMMAILNEEQQEKVNALRTQLDNGEMPEFMIEKKLERMTEKLDLTEEQQAKVRALFDEMAEKHKKLFEAGMGRFEIREEMHAYVDDIKAKATPIRALVKKIMADLQIVEGR